MIASRPDIEALQPNAIQKKSDSTSRRSRANSSTDKRLLRVGSADTRPITSNSLPWERSTLADQPAVDIPSTPSKRPISKPANSERPKLRSKSAVHTKKPVLRSHSSPEIKTTSKPPPPTGNQSEIKTDPNAKSLRPAKQAKLKPKKAVAEPAQAHVRPPAKPEDIKPEAVEGNESTAPSKPKLVLPDASSLNSDELVVSYQLAGGRSRALAILVDAVLLLGCLQVMAGAGLFGTALQVFLPTIGLDGFSLALHSGGLAKLLISAIIMGFAISFGSHIRFGRSAGEWLAGLHVVKRSTGRRPELSLYAIRTLLSVFGATIFGAGFLWILVDKEFRTWHDRLTRTTVIDFQPGATSTTVSPTTNP